MMTHTLQEIFGGKTNLALYTDCCLHFVLSLSSAQMTDRSVQIDLLVIREAYERREVSTIVRIEGRNGPADGLTKVDRRSTALMNVIATSQFRPTAESWTDGNGKEVQTSSGIRDSEQNEKK